MTADRRTWYVKRTRWQTCERADQPSHYRPQRCPHQPRCTMGESTFGRWREGWTRVRGDRQAAREAAAWAALGWTTATVPTSPEVRAEVAAWERQAKGYPGEQLARTRAVKGWAFRLGDSPADLEEEAAIRAFLAGGGCPPGYRKGYELARRQLGLDTGVTR